MDMNEPYPTEVTKRITAFVDRIEQVLLSRGTPRAERTSICQEVETQIQMLIERKMESGAELSVDLVNGIIETMDPPESYAGAIDPVAEPALQTEALPPKGNQSSKQPEGRPWSKPPFVATLQRFLDRPKRTTPTLDWVAICGLMATCFGLFLMVARPGRGDGAVIIGLFIVMAGVASSVVSFWRIRHSNGLLTGQRIASLGILLLPLLLLNAFVIAISFATRIGIVLGLIAVVAALIYGNYYVLRRAMRWLANYTVKVPEVELGKSDLSADNATLSSLTN